MGNKVVDNSTFMHSLDMGASGLKNILWHFTSAIIFRSALFPTVKLKILILRLFGAKIGKGVMLKPCINIKFPWKLEIGDYTWIGEDVWIDNLAKVTIGKSACISQGAFLLTGNHNFTTPTFDLITKEIILESGVWIGAKAIVCPGVTCKSHSILTVSSVATHSLEPYGIYRGYPAIKIKKRIIL